MSRLACLWYRSCVRPYADGALEGLAARAVAVHVERCAGCRQRVEVLTRGCRLLRSAAAAPPEPDWSALWPAIQRRIATEAPRPIQEPWWLPWWTPVWGHPRLATSGALAGALLLTFSFWPVNSEVTASGSPVVVQDVAAADPRGTVMVYSNKDSDVTVIWVFAADTGSNDD